MFIIYRKLALDNKNLYNCSKLYYLKIVIKLNVK